MPGTTSLPSPSRAFLAATWPNAAAASKNWISSQLIPVQRNTGVSARTVRLTGLSPPRPTGALPLNFQ